MKASELMIGDWVLCKGTQTKVRHINDYGDIGLDFGIDNDYPYGIHEIEPIPLTPEILEKNGFELKSDGWLWCKEGIEDQNYIFIQFRKGCNGVRNCEINFVHKAHAIFDQMNYVHQLQHALRLCGIDKEIEL